MAMTPQELKAAKVAMATALPGAVLERGEAVPKLIGRHEDGTWFFADQGPDPATGIQVPTHDDLVKGVVNQANWGKWLFPGNKSAWVRPPTVGFVPMGGIQPFLSRGPERLLKPGEKLAEIDAGWLLSVVCVLVDFGCTLVPLGSTMV